MLLCWLRPLGSVQYGILAAAFAIVSMFSQYSPMGSGFLFFGGL
jgi:hypothetical protein